MTDGERHHDLGAAVIEYEHLRKVFPALGYATTALPKCGVGERADIVLQMLATRAP